MATKIYTKFKVTKQKRFIISAKSRMHQSNVEKRFLSVLRNHRLVNFVDCASRLEWCAKRTRGYILVWAECPYTQW
jgi:hypothetical protein